MASNGNVLVAILILTTSTFWLQPARSQEKKFGRWKFTDDGECLYKSKDDKIKVLTCDKGGSLQSEVQNLSNALAELQTTVKNQENVISGLEKEVKRLSEQGRNETKTPDRVTAKVSLNPVWSLGTNCAEKGETCGIALTVDGETGLVCWPANLNNDWRRKFGHAVMAEAGLNPDDYMLTLDLFNKPDGLPGFWSIEGCGDGENLEDYADCPEKIKMEQCSPFQGDYRYFAIRKPYGPYGRK